MVRAITHMEGLEVIAENCNLRTENARLQRALNEAELAKSLYKSLYAQELERAQTSEQARESEADERAFAALSAHSRDARVHDPYLRRIYGYSGEIKHGNGRRGAWRA